MELSEFISYVPEWCKDLKPMTKYIRIVQNKNTYKQFGQLIVFINRYGIIHRLRIDDFALSEQLREATESSSDKTDLSVMIPEDKALDFLRVIIEKVETSMISGEIHCENMTFKVSFKDEILI